MISEIADLLDLDDEDEPVSDAERQWRIEAIATEMTLAKRYIANRVGAGANIDIIRIALAELAARVELCRDTVSGHLVLTVDADEETSRH